MRSKEQIIDQLNKIPKPLGSHNQASFLLTKLMIEALIDIREELAAISKTLKDYDMVAYKSK